MLQEHFTVLKDIAEMSVNTKVSWLNLDKAPKGRWLLQTDT